MVEHAWSSKTGEVVTRPVTDSVFKRQPKDCTASEE